MPLEFQKPWARTSSKTTRLCGFLTIANRSSAPDRLLSATSPVARTVVLCGIKVMGATMSMGVLKDGLKVPAESTITLRPRGYHLCFLGTKRRPEPGDKVPVVLTFEKAGEQTFLLDVQAPGPVGKETLNEGAQA
jgi:copper(I)-binding protein